MKRRIDYIISRNNFDGYKPYYNQLLQNSELLDNFISYITINVSEFFRNPKQWTVLEEDIIPTLVKKYGKLKIWSAACSTGEEPYSLAILLSKLKPLIHIEILATDLDRDVLDIAKKGLYHEKSMVGLSPEIKKEYFSAVGAGYDKRYQIDNRIRKCIKFRQHDLLRDPYPQNCNLIICRNVMIYFTEEAKKKLYEKFHKSLSDEGVFFVGSTEQIILPQRYNFKPIKTFFYKKDTINKEEALI